MPSRPRGRPRAFDPATALAAASERFRRQGFAATSLDDLVDATGIARPSLYAAFGDKRALYLATLARTEARVAAMFDDFAEAGLALRPLVAAMLEAATDSYLAGDDGATGCLAIGTAASEAPTDPEIRAALAAFVAMEDRRIEELLAAAGSPAPAAHARMAASVIHSISVRARAGASRVELEQLVRDCVDLVAPEPRPA